MTVLGQLPAIVFVMLVLSQRVVLASQSADSVDLVSEADLYAEIPIVISATRLAQRTDETPVAVTVIDRATIDASGAVELFDLLRLVPGFQVGMTTGNLATVTVHGTGTPWFSRLQVLVDGRSVYHTTFSGLDWAQLGVALSDVERIEVVRGPNIASYGANAIQGTINIVTRHPVQDRGFFAQVTVGSWDRLDGVLRYGAGAGDLDYRLTLQHRENTGFDQRVDGTDLNALSWRSVYTPTTRDELDIQLEVSKSHMGEELIPGFFPADIRDIESSSLFVRWTHTEDNDASWQLQFNRSAYKSDEDARLLVSDWYGVAPAVVPFIIGQPDQYFSYNQFETDSLTHDIEIQRASLLGQDLRLTIGGGYRWEEVRHFLTADKQRSANSLRVFGAVEWRPTDAWVVTANALLDDNSLGGTSISPRIGANYRLANGDTLRAAATRGHKHPSLLEENWDAAMRLDDGTPITLWAKSDGDLDAEQRTVFEVGYLGQRLDNRLQFDVRLYHEDVDDAVIYARDVTCPQPIGFPFCYRIGNYLAYEAVGAELGLVFRATPRDTARISYAYADVDGSVPYYLVPEIGQDLEHTAPRHSGSLLLSHRFDQGWEASAALYAAKKTNWYIDGGLVDDVLRLDLRLAREMKFGTTDAKLELLVQNLGGAYEEFTPQNRFDTRAFMRFGIELP